LPFHYSHQIQGKVLSGLFFAGINLLILVPVLVIVFKMPLFLIFIFILTSFLSILFVSFSGLLIDLYNPKLDWSREQSAVKKNINVMLAFIPVLLMGGLIFLMAFTFNLTFYWLNLSIILLFILFDLVLYKILMHQGIELYAKV
jgi:ABC-2 type transport system permease protein